MGFKEYLGAMLAPSDYSALRAFLAVAEALSFSRAAGTLGVSASALSQMVRGLEERVGARLLDRTTRNVSLTESGRALYDRAHPMLQELTDAFAAVRRSGGRTAGLVRVHAFRLGAERFLTPILAAFTAEHPDIVLDIAYDDTVVDLLADGFDIGIRLGEVIARDMVAIRLGPDLRQVAIASPAYLAEHGRPATPQDLLDHKCIRWRWPGHRSPYKWEFHDDGHTFEVAVQGSLIVDSIPAAVRAAADGVGIAFAAEQAIAAYAPPESVERLLEGWTASFPGFHLCYPRARDTAPAVRVLIDAIAVCAGWPVA